jgi:hypothetical protein
MAYANPPNDGTTTTTTSTPTAGSIVLAQLAPDVVSRLLATKAPKIADAAAAPTQADFNALLTALRTAGVIAS